MKHTVTPETIERIRQMESCFDELCRASAHQRTGPWFEEQLQTLVAYYDSGEWLHDYELDEQGLLPPDLKRGVLSQDAVYDFLTDLRR